MTEGEISSRRMLVRGNGRYRLHSTAFYSVHLVVCMVDFGCKGEKRHEAFLPKWREIALPLYKDCRER